MNAVEIPTPPPAAPAQAANPKWKRLLTFENRYLPPLLITCILLAVQFAFGMLESWTRTGTAIATCVIAEMILGRLMLGKWPHLASAYISGISVGILIRSPLPSFTSNTNPCGRAWSPCEIATFNELSVG